jgi:hypothetical protein
MDDVSDPDSVLYTQPSSTNGSKGRWNHASSDSPKPGSHWLQLPRWDALWPPS